MDLVVDDRQAVFFPDQCICHRIPRDDLAPLVQSDDAHRLPGKGRAVKSPLLIHLDQLHAIGNRALDMTGQHFKKFAL